MNRILNNRLLQKSAVVILIISAWELVALSNIFPAIIFPDFLMIMNAFIEGISSGILLEKTTFSLAIILQGILLSVITAFTLSFLANISRTAENVVDVLNSILHPLPGIALLPVAILWFGMGKLSLIFIVVHSVLWPMVVNFRIGFKAIPRIYIELGHSFGLTGIKLLWGVMLPASLPYILSGLNIGWARGWRAVIGAEMVFGAAAGTAGGLGWHIFISRYMFDIAGTFAALIAIVIVGIIVEEVFFNYIEEVTVRKWGMIT